MSYRNLFPHGEPLLSHALIVEIATEVGSAIRNYDAMEHFRDMIRQWACYYISCSEEAEELRKKRVEYEDTVRTGPQLQDEKAGPPEQNWRFEPFMNRRCEDGKMQLTRVDGWVPPELSAEKIPQWGVDYGLPLPVPNCAVALLEKYAALAAIHDYGSKGVAKINPWDGAPGKPNGFPYTRSLMKQVQQIPASDEAHLKRWLAEIKLDLETGNLDLNVLSDRQKAMLQAMYEGKAFDRETCMTTKKIAEKAEGNTVNATNFKEPMADLRQLGLVDTLEGRQGGCWLTPKGRHYAEVIRCP